ncbi:hypothetical protein TWF569_006591 [Orbilia oligospora]|uniref:PXA domain-containing protein n=1 Tax=Orbilia oligospora TaxID=2813651 RepID=A0A7C8IYU0_ORBOL|nr:hypothetical protein TWF103_004008 [Orbilia oligospora]KAF3082921.1 hypothetical protein TWF102_001014 [Orbilia oligospora]KAF3135326.1 hypothetical protein TWF594_008398 [Orbilia oligospora]KAF3145532.1 hypothetical protein TWF569_006591 [Orbilia oligospora]
MPPSNRRPGVSLADSEERNLAALTKRVLCAHAPVGKTIEEVLPALTSLPKVDLQLYGFISIILRDFVQSWYQKITPDHEFIDEIVLIIAHCTLSLEQRIRQVDLETLLLEEAPVLLETHVKDYRVALERQSTALFPHATVNEIFHSMQPHPALLSSPESERLYLKMLGSGVLTALLPPADLQSDCERLLVREILSNMVLWNVVDRLSEPFMLFEMITKVVTVLTAPNKVKPKTVSHAKSTELMSLLQTEPPEPIKKADDPDQSIFQALSTAALTYLEHAYTFISTTAVVARHASASLMSLWKEPPQEPPRRRKQILKLSVWKTLVTLFSLDRRQPWLLGSIQLAAKPLTEQPPGSLIDNYLSHVFTQSLLNEEILIKILSIARNTLFPNGSLAPPRTYPTEDEKVLIQKQAELAIWNAIPDVLKSMYLPANKDDQLREIGESLAFLRSRSCNKHLVYRLLDLLVARLVPEMVEG